MLGEREVLEDLMKNLALNWWIKISRYRVFKFLKVSCGWLVWMGFMSWRVKN